MSRLWLYYITWIDARFRIKGGDSAQRHQYPTRKMLYKLISSAILLLALAQGVTSSPSFGARLVRCTSNILHYHDKSLIMHLAKVGPMYVFVSF